MVLSALVAGCSGSVDVAVEARSAIVTSTTTTTTTTATPAVPPVTAAPVPPVVSTTTSPSTTEPMPPMDPATAARLLLVDSDVSGWKIEGPRSVAALRHAPTTCEVVDVVLDAGDRMRMWTNGALASGRFDNHLGEMETVDVASALIDATETAPLACPTFETGNGEASVRAIAVPAATGWRAAGIVLGGSAGPGIVGFWQRDALVVQLEMRSVTLSEFDEVAGVLAAKLASVVTGVEFERGDILGEAWQTHPLAPLILDDADVGLPWARAGVEVVVARDSPAGPGFCGVRQPAEPAGLTATFEWAGKDAILVQKVSRSNAELAQAWVDVDRRIGDCVESGSGQIISRLDVPTPDTIGADDVVGLRFDGIESEYPYLTIWISARFDDVYVNVWCTVYLDDELVAAMPDPDEMVQFVALSAPR